MNSTAKVGLLVVVFVVLAIASFSVLGKSLVPSSYQTYYVDMSDAGGLTPGSRVLMAGVPVGEIHLVELHGPYSARLTLHVARNVHLPDGTVAVIPGSLIGLGDTPMTLVPPPNARGILASGSIIPGSKAGPLDGLLPNGGKELYNEANRTLVSVRKLLEDKRLQQDLHGLMTKLDTTLQASQVSMSRFNDLAATAHGLLARNEGSIDAMVKSFQSTLAEIHITATAVAKFAKEGKLQKGTTALLDKATKIADEADVLLAQLNKTATDPKINKEIRDTLHNVDDASSHGPPIAANAEKITDNIATITEKSKDLPDKLSDVAVKASKLEDRLSELLDKVTGVLNKKPSTGGLSELSTELDLVRQTSPGYTRTDINLRYPLHEGFVTLGLYDAFESDKFNLQLGHTVTQQLDFRYGIYASKPGAGVDYSFNSKLGIRTDLWDLNSPNLDARFRYDFGNGLIGWIGADKIFNGTYPEIGIGIRH